MLEYVQHRSKSNCFQAYYENNYKRDITINFKAIFPTETCCCGETARGRDEKATQKLEKMSRLLGKKHKDCVIF